MSRILPLIFAILFLTEANSALSGIDTSEFNMDDHTRCSKLFAGYEAQHAIPNNLLRSISLAESGLWHSEDQVLVPWPWTANVEGKPYFFKNKKEAVHNIKRMLASGKKSIDVGCMQINLFYHPAAFNNLEEAFDPKLNIEYAAEFLKNNMKRHDNWKRAIAAYHSETATHGKPYAAKVINILSKLPKTLPKTHISTANYTPSRKTSPKNTYQTKNGDSSYFQSVRAERRKSNLLIQVRNGNEDTSQTVANITRNALNLANN